jgi:hypothetical protein
MPRCMGLRYKIQRWVEPCLKHPPPVSASRRICTGEAMGRPAVTVYLK